MSHRTIEFSWLPDSQKEWRTFTASRREAARLWNDLVIRHARLRRLHWKWPSKHRWQMWAKGKYPALSAQSVQQIVGEFCEAVNAITQLRKNGHEEACYPWRRHRYRDVIYTNQDARLREGYLVLPHGHSGHLRIRIPDGMTLPGRLMEVRLMYGRVLIVCKVSEELRLPVGTIGVDLGVNTLIAATDGARAIVISGREAKATVQWRNKKLAGIQEKQSTKQKGSSRWLKLQRRKHKMLGKAKRRIKDICHKATRQVAEAFPDATCYVGEPFNDAAQKMGRAQAQQVSQACNARLIFLLSYKLVGATVIPEPYTSQTCPVCGKRSKHKRVYRCSRCGMRAPRDVVGCTNILALGETGEMLAGRSVPNAVRFTHPSKYPGKTPGSSGGHPACSSQLPLREARDF